MDRRKFVGCSLMAYVISLFGVSTKTKAEGINKLEIGKELLTYEETKKEVEAISAQYGSIDIELLPPDSEGLSKLEYEGEYIGILHITELLTGRVFTCYIWPVNLRNLYTYQKLISRSLREHECKSLDGKRYYPDGHKEPMK